MTFTSPTMKHKIALVLALFALILLGAPCQAAIGKSAKPNVLFIAIDDLNDWVGVLGGHPQAKTPNIDRLARMGILFTHTYCAAPACNPSRVSLLTGLRPSSTGIYHNPNPWRKALPNVVTLPRYFFNNGYRVWGGGKIFHGSFPDPSAWHEYFQGQNKFPANKMPKNGIGGNMTWGPLSVEDDAMPDTQMTDWAIKKLAQKHDQPFFLAVGYIKPHLTWHAPQKYFKMHPLAKVELPKVNESDLNDIPPAGIKMAKPQGDHRKITEKGVWKEAVQAYLATSTYMDGQLGRLLDALAKSPHAENTIVILWSDHGWHLGEKEHWRKFALWEEACRVPMIAVVPGMTQPGRRCDRTVNLMDIYPTLVELCKLPERKDLHGHSLVPLLKNPKAKWEHPSITTHGRNNHAVRTEQWRYIRYADGSEELYNHDADPMEWTNLARDPKYMDVKKDLAKYLPTDNVPEVPKGKGKAKKNNNKNKKQMVSWDMYPLLFSGIANDFGPQWRKPRQNPKRIWPMTARRVDATVN